jgi:4-carboxymuconolactone decarboxylase
MRTPDDRPTDPASDPTPGKYAAKSETWKRGYAVRSKVLGQAYVDQAIDGADDITRDLQDYLTEHAWGASWARPGLDHKSRSMLNLAMITALNRPRELELHVRGALRNGVTRDEMKEIFLHTAVYCGAPAALDSFRILRKVLADQDPATPNPTGATRHG